MVVISLLVGLVAVVLATNWITQQANMAATKVIVARTDIDMGAKLSPEMLNSIDWPKGSIPTGSFTDTKQLEDRVMKTSITRGEPILDAKLAPIGTKGGLSAVVAEGKRAMTVRVNDVVGVAGFALPGNFVDIVVNTQNEVTKATPKDQAKDPSISKIVLEHILVLAVAQEVSHDDTKPKVVNAVTLEVTPEEAEKLDLARSVGSLSLVLRNQVDPKMAETKGATKTTLLGITAPPPKQAEVKQATVQKKPRVKRIAMTVPRATTCVEIVQGAGRTVECF